MILFDNLLFEVSLNLQYAATTPNKQILAEKKKIKTKQASYIVSIHTQGAQLEGKGTVPLSHISFCSYQICGETCLLDVPRPPSAPSTLHISERPDVKDVLFSFYGSQVWGSRRNQCVLPAPFYENQNMNFLPCSSEPLPVLCITAASLTGKLPLREKWRKRSWNKAPSTQYCKMTSELAKNDLHQRLLCCATIR